MTKRSGGRRIQPTIVESIGEPIMVDALARLLLERCIASVNADAAVQAAGRTSMNQNSAPAANKATGRVVKTKEGHG